MDEANLADVAAHFSDPENAAEFLEGIRWPNSVVCPKCGEFEREPYRLKNQKRPALAVPSLPQAVHGYRPHHLRVQPYPWSLR